MEIVHTPVLPEECLKLLAPVKDGSVFVDGTVGEGGHAERFLRAFPTLNIIGLDADADIIGTAEKRLAVFGERITFHRCWSEDFFEAGKGSLNADRILLDLGVSLFHYEKGGRGFSFNAGSNGTPDEPLDMRIDVSTGRPASALIAELNERDLADLLYNNAGERNSRRIAAAIVQARRTGPIRTSGQLAEIVRSVFPPSPPRTRGGRSWVIDPATRTFQALRIAVNGELEKLEGLLEAAFECLAAEGRLGVITFHSLEDRTVKNVFRAKKQAGLARLVTPKPVACGEEEARVNPPSRSAKLRVLEKSTGV
jgi:16S rRNA (cytosine1402-N4)-methyltransferase